MAAHITAAASGGPRYDPALTSEERRGPSNGIWLCQNCAKLIDSDTRRFPISTLQKWKAKAEEQAFIAVATSQNPHVAKNVISQLYDDLQYIRELQLPAEEDLVSITESLRTAARADVEAFTNVRDFPKHTIPLAFRYQTTERDTGSSHTVTLSGLAATIETIGEMSLVAAPGTGKTTTLVQAAETILSVGSSVAVLVPLAEWSTQHDVIFKALTRRNAFRGFREEHFMLLAFCGRLVLLLDGWNELDSTSRTRAMHELDRLKRDFPLINMVISTRSQSRDVFFEEPTIEIESLSKKQQLEIARVLCGDDGVKLLDHAWRTPGVRELVSIPLYLSALLTSPTSGAMPSTKEEVLRLFVIAQERLPARAEVLNRELHGSSRDMLVALATEATDATSTVIEKRKARSVITAVENKLVSDGQITTRPQPSAVLDVLVNLHMLIRAGFDGDVAFQHQQFQEWYASFYVEDLLLAVKKGNEEASKRLTVEVLNKSAWEEPVLFACDRLSRENGVKAQAVAEVVATTLSIDPMLAAEMVFRSGETVWDLVENKITAFAERWHKPGTVDRALRFMIATGRPEFAEHLWSLMTNPDPQVHLAALRAAHRIRPSVLGANPHARFALMSENIRQDVIAEIALNSGMDGLELAASLARADPSASVQCAAIEALCFRHADRLVSDLLETAPDRVWQMLARKGFSDDIADPELAIHLRQEYEIYVEAEGNVLTKIALLLKGDADAGHADQVAQLISSNEFAAKENEARWVLARAFERYPEQVAAALIQRIEARREVPFGCEDMLKAAAIVDAGAIPELVIDPTSDKHLAQTATAAVGPETVSFLIDAFLVHDAVIRGPNKTIDEPMRQRYWTLLDRISATRITSFLPALAKCASTEDPQRIGTLADLLALHGKFVEARPICAPEELLKPIVEAIHRWVELLLTSSVANRHQFANVAQAIERLPMAEFVDDLRRLLAEDLKRWKRSRETFLTLPANLRPTSDAYMSYTLQYQRAMAAIGNDEVARLMQAYLTDLDFGVEAAFVLLEIWKVHQDIPKQMGSRSWPDFSQAKERRTERQETGAVLSSPLGEPMFAAIEKLIGSDSTSKQHLNALKLGGIALSMPHHGKGQIIDALLTLPLPTVNKLGLLGALVSAGYIIKAGMVLDGAKQLIEAAKTKSWMLGEDGRELGRWLELMPFSDRPAAVLEILEFVDLRVRAPWHLRNLLEALRYAPDNQAEHVLGELARRDPQFLQEPVWLTAVCGRNTASSGMLLLDLICDENLTAGTRINAWDLARGLTGIFRSHPELRTELTKRYQMLAPGSGRSIIAAVIKQLADPEGVLTLVCGYAQEHRPFDGQLRSMIEDVALRKEPVRGLDSSYELYPADITELRKNLFSMLVADDERSRVAEACLIAIDEIRDQYGRTDTEPRHPDIASGCPWPLAAQAGVAPIDH